MALNRAEALIIGILISCAYVSSYPAIHNAHMQKRQSYGRSNQLVPNQDHYYGQPSYNSYNYEQEPQGARRNYYNNGHQSNYYDYPPSQQQYYGRDRDPLQGSYASANPIQREINVRNGQLRQKEYQKRTGQEGRDTYDPFYFYINPIAGATGNSPAPVVVSPSPDVPDPTTVTAALNAASREHVVGVGGGPPRNRRNSLNAPPRDPYFDNEISGDKYEILTSKPSYPSRLQNSYPPSPAYPSSRYSTGPTIGYNHPPPGNPNQFLNYEQIVGAQPPRYANGSPPPPSRGQPWSIQIGTQLKVNDDGKGSNSGGRFYVRDERNTRSRQPPYHK